jgi:hypothetical protein
MTSPIMTTVDRIDANAHRHSLHQKKRVNMSIQSLTTVCAGWVRSWSRPWLACAAMGLLSACGGGGGGGESPGTTVVQGLASAAYDANQQLIYGGGVGVVGADGSVFTINTREYPGLIRAIALHPRNQLCRLTVSGSRSDVTCSDTLINDTGLAVCFENERRVSCDSGGATAAAGLVGVTVAASSGSAFSTGLQDGARGRDPEGKGRRLNKAGCGSGGFDFSRLREDGSVLPESFDAAGGCFAPVASDPAWKCTRDNVTGLVWLRGDSSKVAFFGLATPPSASCGQRGWRRPQVGELASLLNGGSESVAVDKNYFPDMRAGLYWSGTESALSTGTLDAYGVDFTSSEDIPAGRVALVSKSLALPTIWVASDVAREQWRSDRSMNEASKRFEVPENFQKGVIIDRFSGLMWMLCSYDRTARLTSSDPCSGEASEVKWGEALRSAQTASESKALGYSDWRLPNRAELLSLVDYSRATGILVPSELLLDVQNISGGVGTSYWTSSGVARDTGFQAGAFFVDFKYGTTGILPVSEAAGDNNNRARVRLVRSLP